ncbi:unnamed protein product [Ectocarpus sp. 6 AP-2014]
MNPAPAPTQASVGEPGLSRPQRPQASTTGQGATSVMIRPLFALEDVLYIVVVARSFFFWSFTSVFSRAMNASGSSNHPRPLSSPRIAAGSPSAPSAPAGLARAAPRTSRNYRVAGRRGAWRTLLVRIVEVILAMCVCGVLNVLGGDGVSVPTSLGTTLLSLTLSLSATHKSIVKFDLCSKTRRLWSMQSAVDDKSSDDERSDLDSADLS